MKLGRSRLAAARWRRALAFAWGIGVTAGAAGNDEAATAAMARAGPECVVLLHGLARWSDSMAELKRKLGRAGYLAVNIGYRSRSAPIAALAEDAVGRGLAACRAGGSGSIHFVTHSLGGMLLRQYLQDRAVPELGRVVMLAPPNQGSRVVDRLRRVPGFGLLGPAAAQLGTGADGIAAQLEPVAMELGVIAGSINVNPFGFLFFTGPNDSILMVASTRLADMAAHVVLPAIHTFIMRDNRVIDNVIHFLKTGAFMPDAAEPRP